MDRRDGEPWPEPAEPRGPPVGDEERDLPRRGPPDFDESDEDQGLPGAREDADISVPRHGPPDFGDDDR